MAESEHEPAGEGTSSGGSGGGGGGGEVRDQDRLLPMANIARIMKKGLPGDVWIARDAKEEMQKCVTEFIHYITSDASCKCWHIDRRKTIVGDDILYSMNTLGFYSYKKLLERYLHKYKQWEEKNRQILIGENDDDPDDTGKGEAEMTGSAADGDDDPDDDVEVEADMAGAVTGGSQQKINIGTGDDKAEAEENTDAAMGERQHQTGGDYDYDVDDVLRWLNDDAFASENGSP